MPVLRCKVAVLGDATVGKSAWLQMFFSNGTNFPRQYVMTISADLCIKELEVPDAATPNTVVELYMMDIAGQEVYRRFAEQHIENANYFVIVYDVGNRATFDGASRWLEMIKKQKKAPFNGVLVANKCDHGDRGEVVEAQGEQLARQHNLAFFKISALRGDNVAAPMAHIANAYAQAYEDRIRTLQFVK